MCPSTRLLRNTRARVCIAHVHAPTNPKTCARRTTHGLWLQLSHFMQHNTRTAAWWHGHEPMTHGRQRGCLVAVLANVPERFERLARAWDTAVSCLVRQSLFGSCPRLLVGYTSHISVLVVFLFCHAWLLVSVSSQASLLGRLCQANGAHIFPRQANDAFGFPGQASFRLLRHQPNRVQADLREVSGQANLLQDTNQPAPEYFPMRLLAPPFNVSRSSAVKSREPAAPGAQDFHPRWHGAVHLLYTRCHAYTCLKKRKSVMHTPVGRNWHISITLLSFSFFFGFS
jgi:hypothetical protein